MSALTRLRSVAGDAAVHVDVETRRIHGSDMTEIDDALPDAVVSIEELATLQAIVRLADELRVPIVPRVAGTNLGGLTIPGRGGWTLDLSRMRRIVDLDRDDMVAVIEPGVTFAELKEALDACEPPLTIGFPLSPPDVSVAANCLLDGLGNLSLLHGTMGDGVSGLEVVRADGSLLRTGAWALGVPVPFGRAPLPDLTGLFLSWQGTTGVVSKLALHLWPELAHRRRSFVLAYDRRATMRALRELPRLELLHDLGGLSWPTAKLLFGVHHPAERDPAEPEFFFYMDVKASSAALLAAKEAAIVDYLASLRRDGLRIDDPIDVPTLVAFEPRLEPLASFPTRLDFLLDHPDGGLTWVGTYGPLSRFEAACERGMQVAARHGFPPMVVARPMRGGHYAVLRFIQIFRRDDDADRARVHRCNVELCDTLLGHGFVMYKTPSWAVDRYREHLDAGFVRLATEVRGLLDPHHIMNPGRWELYAKG